MQPRVSSVPAAMPPLIGQGPLALPDTTALRLSSLRAAQDLSFAITALENCRGQARGPAATDTLELAIGRLQGAHQVHLLQSGTLEDEVDLSQRIYELVVALKDAHSGVRPIQLSFCLEAVSTSQAVKSLILALLAEAIGDLLDREFTDRGGSIAFRLACRGEALELGVQRVTLAGGSMPQPLRSGFRNQQVIDELGSWLAATVAYRATSDRVDVAFRLFPGKLLSDRPRASGLPRLQSGGTAGVDRFQEHGV